MTVHQLISWAAFPRILQSPDRLPANAHTCKHTIIPLLCNGAVWQSQSLRGRAGITFYSEVLEEEAEEEEGAVCQRGSAQETHAVPFPQCCLMKRECHTTKKKKKPQRKKSSFSFAWQVSTSDSQETKCLSMKGFTYSIQFEFLKLLELDTVTKQFYGNPNGHLEP